MSDDGCCLICGQDKRQCNCRSRTDRSFPRRHARTDGETVTNAQGGRQSHVAARLDLIPPEALLLLGECLGFGAEKYGEGNWQKIPERDHVNHAMVHLTNYLAGDRREMHLVNTLARVSFALWHAIEAGHPKQYQHPDLAG